jgi:iron complex outermembrane receptor protein/hemoglobin/transferrin/lactoferrin receptor protein
MWKPIAIATLLALPSAGAGSPARAHPAGDIDDLLSMSLQDLLNVTVTTASRHEEKAFESPRSIAVVTAREIRERNYRTTPEALADIAGVLVQETNYGGGSPIVRGLIGNQILVLVDGVRINNAIFRLGPNQYLNTIDIHQVERIEVVRGTGSTLYGSDALGGTIHVITKSPRAPGAAGTDDPPARRIFTRYASADRGATGRIDLAGSRDRVRAVGGISVKSFGDLRAGGATGLQPFTGYDEWDADLKVVAVPARDHEVTVSVQHVHQNGVPRSDKLLSGDDRKREWDPESRSLVNVQLRRHRALPGVRDLLVGVDYQEQSERLFRIPTSSPDVERRHRDVVRTIGFQALLDSRLGRRHRLTWGFDFAFDHVNSTRVDVDLETGVETEKTGNFADDSEFRSYAGFIHDEVEMPGPLDVSLGLRYTGNTLEAAVEDPATGRLDIHTTSHALTGSVFARLSLGRHLSLNGGVSQGFRAPNIDDTTVLGTFASGFEVPNPALDPEQSVNVEVGLKANHPRFTGAAFYFRSAYRDIIEREPGTYDGLSFLDEDGDGVRDDGEDAVFQRRNTGRARIHGSEAEARLRLRPAWTAFGGFSWTHGENIVDDVPFRRIPPAMGFFGVRWRPSERLWLEHVHRFAGRQARLAPEDIDDPRIPDGGTPGYLTWNLRGGLDLERLGNLTLSLENLTNTKYRLHGSGIDAPGRSLVIGYELPL